MDAIDPKIYKKGWNAQRKSGFLGKKHSEKSLGKMRKAHKGNTNMLGKKHTEITKKKISETIMKTLGKEIRYKIDLITNCWNWQLAKNKQGYGIATEKGKYVRAHRLYYERVNGKIPKGLTIDHLCNNKSCVNPKHLEAVTLRINTQRRLSNKLNPQKVKDIRLRYDSGFSQKELAGMFGVSYENINRVIRKEAWVNI